jgi:hypothetical protein
MEQTTTWPTIKTQMLDQLQASTPKPFHTNFTFDEQTQTLKYDVVPMITILSISTGIGDLEFEMITQLRLRTTTNICLIIIDPYFSEAQYERFLPIVHTLYVNPWLDGIAMLEFEQLDLPRQVFKQFDVLLSQNLTELNLVFVANFQFTGSSVLRSLRPDRVPSILLDYRSEDYQKTVQGLKPTGTKWVKQGLVSEKSKSKQRLYQIQQSSLNLSFIHRKIWRYYKTILHKEETPLCMISNPGSQTLAKGFWQREEKKLVVISTFLEFYNYFKTRPQ